MMRSLVLLAAFFPVVAAFAGEAPCEVRVFGDAPAGAINHALVGIAPGGNYHSYLKPEVVQAIGGIGLKTGRLEGVTASYAELYDPATGKYDWTRLDREIEAMKKAGIKTIIADLYYTPKWLAASPAAADFYARRPGDLKAWSKYVSDIVRHVNIERKYGITYWEFWNEPSGWLFNQDGGNRAFFEFYAATAKAIKSADPAALVGGFGDNANYPEHYQAFFAFAKATGAPIDFLTYHWYGEWEANGERRPDLYFQFTKALADTYEAAFGRRVPVFISEWNMNGERADGTPAQHAAFLAASLFWMQESGLSGACFFCAENYRDLKRGLLDDQVRPVQAARVLAMFVRLPAQRVDARWNNPEFTVLAGRGGGKLGVMVSRNSAAAAAGPAALTLKLGGLGQPGLRKVDLCVEDAGSAGVPGALKSAQVRTVAVAKDGTATLLMEMKGFSVLLITLGL